MADGDLRGTVVDAIQDAHAMEQGVVTTLQALIGTVDDPVIHVALEEHLRESEAQDERLRRRLEELGATGSARKNAGTLAGGVLKGVADLFRDDEADRTARDLYATVHFAVAAYELLERLAIRAGDGATAALARESCAEERAMALRLEGFWDRFVDAALREAGVDVPQRPPTDGPAPTPVDPSYRPLADF